MCAAPDPVTPVPSLPRAPDVPRRLSRGAPQRGLLREQQAAAAGEVPGGDPEGTERLQVCPQPHGVTVPWPRRAAGPRHCQPPPRQGQGSPCHAGQAPVPKPCWREDGPRCPPPKCPRAALRPPWCLLPPPAALLLPTAPALPPAPPEQPPAGLGVAWSGLPPCHGEPGGWLGAGAGSWPHCLGCLWGGQQAAARASAWPAFPAPVSRQGGTPGPVPSALGDTVPPRGSACAVPGGHPHQRGAG